RRLAAEPDLETDIYDRVHQGFVDTIIVPPDPQSSPSDLQRTGGPRRRNTLFTQLRHRHIGTAPTSIPIT
ncbi:MAG: hypothetical protein PSV46_16890, partial [Reyranella sp.]|nr:hypothetical protein [Reyranella sp.]